ACEASVGSSVLRIFGGRIASAPPAPATAAGAPGAGTPAPPTSFADRATAQRAWAGATRSQGALRRGGSLAGAAPGWGLGGVRLRAEAARGRAAFSRRNAPLTSSRAEARGRGGSADH